MAAPTDVPVTQAPLSAEQREWLERAWAQIDPERIARLCLDLVRIPSPTGEERAIAEFLTTYLARAGFDARYQPIDPQQGNAVGRLHGQGDGRPVGPPHLRRRAIDGAVSRRPGHDAVHGASRRDSGDRRRGWRGVAGTR